MQVSAFKFPKSCKIFFTQKRFRIVFTCPLWCIIILKLISFYVFLIISHAKLTMKNAGSAYQQQKRCVFKILHFRDFLKLFETFLIVLVPMIGKNVSESMVLETKMHWRGWGRSLWKKMTFQILQ